MELDFPRYSGLICLTGYEIPIQLFKQGDRIADVRLKFLEAGFNVHRVYLCVFYY